MNTNKHTHTVHKHTLTLTLTITPHSCEHSNIRVGDQEEETKTTQLHRSASSDRLQHSYPLPHPALPQTVHRCSLRPRTSLSAQFRPTHRYILGAVQRGPVPAEIQTVIPQVLADDGLVVGAPGVVCSVIHVGG